MVFILKFILVFCLTFASDICWTKYIMYVGKKDAIKAASWSAGIIVCGIVSVISYIDDHWLTIAVLLGSFFGTYYAVYKSKKNDPEDSSGVKG